MEFARRHCLKLAAGAACLPVISGKSWAVDLPTHPVRVVVGFPPAGFTDTTTRLISGWLSDKLGQQFVVENRPGASGNIATEFVARSDPDGYTLLQIGDGNGYNATLQQSQFRFRPRYRPCGERGDRPVRAGGESLIPRQDRSRIHRLCQANPGKINVGSLGPGSPSQLIGVLFKSMAEIDLVTVNYRGIGPALTDLMAGRLEAVFTSLASVVGYVNDNKPRALGVTTAKRAEIFPDVPALGEYVKGYEAAGWVGLGAPAKTTPEDPQ